MKKNANTIFHKKWERSDRMTKDTLTDICERIEASDELKRQIDCRIERVSEKEEHYMKRISMKKVIIGVAVACLAVGTVGIAGSGMKSYIGGTSARADYTEFKDLEKAETEVGIETNAVSKFSNGFTFDGIYIGDLAIQNEAGQEEGNEKEMKIMYRKSNETIMFNARRLFDVESAEGLMNEVTPDKSLQVGDTLAVFVQTTNKFVPPDYELTEEDKANMEKENYNLAYGSSEVEVNQGYHVKWIENGILYSFYGSDLSISPDEMLKMAKEVIESGEQN